MWSQPDIRRLNEQAASLELKREIEDQLAHPEKHDCEVCAWHGIERQANHAYAWHDIFSDDPKGVIHVCDEHDGYTGDPIEGYFTCEHCGKVFISNYTWEIYSSYIEDYGQVCLPCALKLYLEDETHWIDPRAVKQVVFERRADHENVLFDPATGVLNLAVARHLIGVDMPVPDSLKFHRNIEFDAYTGRELAGYSTTFGAGHGEASTLALVEELAEQGYTKFLLVCDGGFQFSVSFGIYVDSQEHERLSTADKSHWHALAGAAL